MILEDFDSRTGSATSLLRTVVGAQLRGIGGWISIADLITVMSAIGVSSTGTRSAVLRVKTKGLLSAETVNGHAGYRLNPDALPMLERGDRRIFQFRQQGDHDPWCLISYSIPETQRDSRHQLRRRLGWIGCGAVSTGLWICPAFLLDEVESILNELGLRDTATLFITEPPLLAGSLAEAASRWWDLARLDALHRSFSARHSLCGATLSPQDAFARYNLALDEWRILPYLDPGLPPQALPSDWPGFDSVALFQEIAATLAAPATEYLRSVVGGGTEA